MQSLVINYNSRELISNKNSDQKPFNLTNVSFIIKHDFRIVLEIPESIFIFLFKELQTSKFRILVI